MDNVARTYQPKPITEKSFFVEDFNEDGLHKALQKGLDDLQNGRTLTVKEVRDGMKRDFGV